LPFFDQIFSNTIPLPHKNATSGMNSMIRSQAQYEVMVIPFLNIERKGLLLLYQTESSTNYAAASICIVIK